MGRSFAKAALDHANPDDTQNSEECEYLRIPLVVRNSPDQENRSSRGFSSCSIRCNVLMKVVLGFKEDQIGNGRGKAAWLAMEECNWHAAAGGP
jgi:hypothetical protein